MLRDLRLCRTLKKHDNLICLYVNSNDLMSSVNLCVSNSLNDVKSRAKSKKRKSKKDSWKPTGKVFTQIGYIWRPTGRTFTIVGNACPLTRITTTNEVPFGKPIVSRHQNHPIVVKLVYSRNLGRNKTAESFSKTMVLQTMLSISPLVFGSPVARQHLSGALSAHQFSSEIGNVTISRVYYVEGLGHNLFSVGQFCDSNLEVAFRQHTEYDGSSSPICLLSKASKTKSWLWHRRLSHLNFGSINHLARHGLVRGNDLRKKRPYSIRTIMELSFCNQTLRDIMRRLASLMKLLLHALHKTAVCCWKDEIYARRKLHNLSLELGKLVLSSDKHLSSSLKWGSISICCSKTWSSTNGCEDAFSECWISQWWRKLKLDEDLKNGKLLRIHHILSWYMLENGCDGLYFVKHGISTSGDIFTKALVRGKN
ncbi:retrovirus-related pol polyprotein from transposon TNT 1-94 [Tanacetum coccineum]